MAENKAGQTKGSAQAYLGTKAMGAGRKKAASSGKKSKIHEMHIRMGKSGGYIARHDNEPDKDSDGMSMMGKSDEHVLADKAALLAHVDKNMPDTPMEDPEADEGEGDQGGGAAA